MPENVQQQHHNHVRLTKKERKLRKREREKQNIESQELSRVGTKRKRYARSYKEFLKTAIKMPQFKLIR